MGVRLPSQDPLSLISLGGKEESFTFKMQPLSSLMDSRLTIFTQSTILTTILQRREASNLSQQVETPKKS